MVSRLSRCMMLIGEFVMHVWLSEEKVADET
jgi:hypothetical protein